MFVFIFVFLSIAVAWSQATFTFGEINVSTFRYSQIKPQLIATYDYMSNTGGETSNSKSIGALDFYLSTDLSKYSGINGSFVAHYGHLERFGNESVIGDTQITSNIDVTTQADRMIDLWYQHNWSGRTKTLFGLHDISTEFNVTESSLNFMNASFGTSAEISYSGVNGPSAYPFTSLGVRIYHQFLSSFSYRGGAYAGDPGAQNTYSSFHSDVGGQDGYFLIQEIAHEISGQKNALGIWNYTTSNSYGAYYIFERDLSDSIAVFARYGRANPDVSMIHSNTAVGGTYRGLFQTKKSMDEVGLGMTQIHFSRGHVSANDIHSSELTYEAYYQIIISSQVSLRPDTQYIISPAGSKELKNAWVWALRTTVEI